MIHRALLQPIRQHSCFFAIDQSPINEPRVDRPHLDGEDICCVTGVHSCKFLVSERIPDDGMLII